MDKVIILGAGISGLSLAWYLQKRKIHVTLIEKEPRVGGWIETTEEQGFLFDRGPRSCRGTSVATLELLQELGLEKEVITAEAKRRFLYLNGCLQPVPNSLLGALFSPLTKGLFAALWRDLSQKGGVNRDESVAAFVERRLGRPFAERFFDPLVTGIFAGDIEKLSVQACFPSLIELETNYGGLVRGMLRRKSSKPEIFSFRNGMETLPKALLKGFQGELLLNAKVQAIDNHAVQLASGETLTADHIFSALPAGSLPQLPVVPFVSLVTVNLGFKKRLPIPKGFGYLIPSSEKEQVLGVVFDSCVFPNRSDETRLTVMSRPTDLPLPVALNALSRHLGIDEEPDYAAIKMASIPQYYVGHLDLVAKLPSTRHFTILGSSYYGVSINDCIAHAKQIALNFSI